MMILKMILILRLFKVNIQLCEQPHSMFYLKIMNFSILLPQSTQKSMPSINLFTKYRSTATKIGILKLILRLSEVKMELKVSIPTKY